MQILSSLSGFSSPPPIHLNLMLLFFADLRFQFDFVKLLDGKALPRSLTDPISGSKAPKGLLLSGLQETGFIEYMDPGTWHLALYNDGRGLEQVFLHSNPIGEREEEKMFFFPKDIDHFYFVLHGSHLLAFE